METPSEVHGVTPMHHFSKASSECKDLYRDGHLISAVMLSQSVAEGIWRFVLERNQIPSDGNLRQPCAPALVRAEDHLDWSCIPTRSVRIW